jgi:hypothetical protein
LKNISAVASVKDQQRHKSWEDSYASVVGGLWGSYREATRSLSTAMSADYASPVAASSFFMIEKMKAAERRQIAMRMPQIANTGILPQSIIGIETR